MEEVMVKLVEPSGTLSGCKSGGTTVLTVATTSLPNAIVGIPYAATLAATGGTPGYTWSQDAS